MESRVSYEHLLLDVADHVGIIKLNRPEVLNAMNRKLFSEIDAALTQLEDDDGVHAIIFTGAGERAFSAGADIHEMAEQARLEEPPPPDPAVASSRLTLKPMLKLRYRHRRLQRQWPRPAAFPPASPNPRR